MNGYLALTKTRIGDDGDNNNSDDADFADDSDAEDAAFESALDDADQGGADPNAAPDDGFDTSDAYGPQDDGQQEDAGGSSDGSGGGGGGGSGEGSSDGGGSGDAGPGPTTSTNSTTSTDTGSGPNNPNTPTDTTTTSKDTTTNDDQTAQLALLQQNCDDAEKAWQDAFQADLDELSNLWTMQQDDTSSPDDIRAEIEVVKPLAAALIPAYDAFTKAKAAVDAASPPSMNGDLFGKSIPDSKHNKNVKPNTSLTTAIKNATALHKRTSTVHAQTAALHTLIKAKGKPMTAATKAKARSLTQSRAELAAERKSVKQALLSAIQKSKTPGTSRTTSNKPTGLTTHPGSFQIKTDNKPSTNKPSTDKPSTNKPSTNKPKFRRIHGHGDVMNGYTILGENAGIGFDLGEMFSSFLTGGAKTTSTSTQQAQMQAQLQMAQMQAQFETQRAKDQAARAKTTAWVIGSVVGVIGLGLGFWKLLG